MKKISMVATASCTPTAFAFFDRRNGSVRFTVAAKNGTLPAEEAAMLLAMHCLVNGIDIQDFGILVVPAEDLTPAVFQKAAANLAYARSIAQVQMSVRQKEVLELIVQNLSNKEIGARLNLSERTIKFHVSGILAKCKVKDRAGLRKVIAVSITRRENHETKNRSNSGVRTLDVA